MSKQKTQTKEKAKSQGGPQYSDLGRREKQEMAKYARDILGSDMFYLAGAALILGNKEAQKAYGNMNVQVARGYFSRKLAESEDPQVRKAGQEILYAISMGEEMNPQKLAEYFQNQLAKAAIGARGKDITSRLGADSPGFFKGRKTVGSIKNEEKRNSVISTIYMAAQLYALAEANKMAGDTMGQNTSRLLKAA